MKSAGINEVTVIGHDEKSQQYRYGVCSTPMAYYAVIDTFDCACLFTASHNPSEYVGIKIVDTKCLSIKSTELRTIFEENEKTDISLQSLPEIKEYNDTKVKSLLADIKEKFQTLKKIPKITVDYSHGAATHFEQTFLRDIL